MDKTYVDATLTTEINFYFQATRVYTGRLTKYFVDVQDFVKETINGDIGRCKSLWNLFDATRIIICKMIVDPLVRHLFASGRICDIVLSK